MRALLVEDDSMLGDTLRAGLVQDGHVIDWVTTTRTATAAIATTRYDAILLDLGLPDGDGMDVIRSVRRHGHATPILVLTARDSVSERVRALDAGADDYLIKPFDLDELAARLRAIRRRSVGHTVNVRHIGPLTLDFKLRSVLLNGAPVIMTPKEWALLERLCAAPGQPQSRAQLEEALYGFGDEVGSNVVEVLIHGLRRKLGADTIRNTRGIGYFVAKPDTHG
jgi:two-component system, OmpR family, response regulator QseB